jgi:magnesium-protoporphyrin O-methyltransferase
MMINVTYERRRGELETYFDRTASQAWARLTSDAPVSRIRATVRAGRDEMRATLLGWLPADLTGCRLLDAGCGTGAVAVEAARRGAEVVAVDLAGTLLDLARTRIPAELAHRVSFIPGDMLDPTFGHFDHVVAMDSLIHYPAQEMVEAISALAARKQLAHRMQHRQRGRAGREGDDHAGGGARGDRAPAIEPVGEGTLNRRLAASLGNNGWKRMRTRRVESGFYKSQALEMVRR